jgi:hypothetical protein
MSNDRPVEPLDVAQEVERFVYDEFRDAAKYSNREPLDESGVYSLHELAARIYQRGFNDGRQVEGWKRNEQRQRVKDAENLRNAALKDAEGAHP